MDILKHFERIAVISAEIFDEISLIEEVGHVFSGKKHLQQCCIAVFVHIFNTVFHIFILLVFIFHGGGQFVFGTFHVAAQNFKLHLCAGYLIAERQDILIDPCELVFEC